MLLNQPVIRASARAGEARRAEARTRSSGSGIFGFRLGLAESLGSPNLYLQFQHDRPNREKSRSKGMIEQNFVRPQIRTAPNNIFECFKTLNSLLEGLLASSKITNEQRCLLMPKK